MKRQLFFLMFGAMLSILSVSCSANTPVDVGIHEPKIKQTATEQMPIELTITPVAYAMDLCVVDLNSDLLCHYVKPAPLVQMVCSIEAPTKGVDGKAVLSWCIYDHAYNRIPVLGFHYLEGIATEYSC